MAERGRRAGSYGRGTGDPTLGELAARSPELAKRWAIALIEKAGPDGFAAVDLAVISRDGAGMIEGLLTATARDTEVPEQDAALAALAGARSPAELARAAEALRTVLWEAAVECSPRARTEPRAARRLSDLGDQLAGACAELLAAELERFVPPDRDPAQEPSRTATAPAGGATRIVIVDERSAEAGPRSAHADQAAADEPAEAAMPAEREPERGGPIAAHDARRQGPAAWIGAIGAQLERFAHDARPFAVMLIELLEAAVAEPNQDPKPALEARLPEWRELTLTRERPGRYWVVAPGADRARAERLRERLETALAGGEPPEGMPSPVAIGVAVCPEDATDAAGLAAQADLDLYAARSHPTKGRRQADPMAGHKRAAGRRSTRP